MRHHLWPGPFYNTSRSSVNKDQEMGLKPKSGSFNTLLTVRTKVEDFN